MSFYSIADFIRENYPEYWGMQSYPADQCVRIYKIDEEEIQRRGGCESHLL